jgi:NAD(P)-dependent dehydrogenase (short-subunit alcohol dehydrogenase family)
MSARALLLLPPVRPVLLGLGSLVALALLLWGVARLAAWLRRRPQEDLHGRWVVVTGCDSGFGQGLVRNLVERGARVVAFCLTPQGAERAMEAGAARAPRLDLSDWEATDGALKALEPLFDGRLWGLVHNAGVVLPGFVDYLPLSFYRRVMEINFFVPVELTRRLLGPLRGGRGRVVFVSSVDGLVSLPGNAPYDASKFALEAYADALRVELATAGVTVSVVNPATMRTPLAMSFFDGHRKAWSAMDAAEPEGHWKALYPPAWLDEYIDVNRRNLERIAQDPGHAIRDITHAVAARHPRMRYLSGLAAKTFFYALWVGPESWSLAIKRALIRPAPKAPIDQGGGRP